MTEEKIAVIKKEEGFGKFFQALNQGIPAIIYQGYICGCQKELRSLFDSGEIEDIVRESKSRIIGIYECEGERGLVQKSGKFFVTPHENPTQTSIAQEIAKDYRTSTLDSVIEEITLTERRDTDKYKPEFLKALTGIQNPEFITQEKIIDELEKTIQEERLTKLNNISLRIGPNSDKLSIHHIDVNGYYLVTPQGEVVGRAKAIVEYSPIQGSLIVDFYKSLEQYGINAKRDYSGRTNIQFAISGMIENGSPIRAVRGSGENLTRYSLHGHEWKENEEFRQEVLDKVKSVREAPEKYKTLVEEILSK